MKSAMHDLTLAVRPHRPWTEASQEPQPVALEARSTSEDTWLPTKSLRGIRTAGRDVGENSHGVFGQGGAGVALVTPRRTHLALFRRSSQVDSPHTWGLPGGARVADDAGVLSDPLRTAVHELYEEVHHLPWGATLCTRPQITHWNNTSYHTFMMEVPFPHVYAPSLNYEHDEWGWFTLRDAQKLSLHPGVQRWLVEHEPLGKLP